MCVCVRVCVRVCVCVCVWRWVYGTVYQCVTVKGGISAQQADIGDARRSPGLGRGRERTGVRVGAWRWIGRFVWRCGGRAEGWHTLLAGRSEDNVRVGPVGDLRFRSALLENGAQEVERRRLRIATHQAPRPQSRPRLLITKELNRALPLGQVGQRERDLIDGVELGQQPLVELGG